MKHALSVILQQTVQCPEEIKGIKLVRLGQTAVF
jgi:hypothetical protein